VPIRDAREDGIWLAVAGGDAGGVLRCQECRTVWTPVETTRWLVLLSEEDTPLVVLYCPDCARREFGVVR
jgi:hypothetical protein